jgi:hypothetical protein
VGTAWSLADTCGQAECIQRQDILYITYESCGFAQVVIGLYTLVKHGIPVQKN